MNEGEGVIEEAARPWGFWATIGFTVVIGIACVMAVFILCVFSLVAGAILVTDFDFYAYTESLKVSGFFMSTSTFVTAIVGASLTFIFVAVRKGISTQEYLGLRWVKRGVFLKWIFVYVLFLILSDGITLLLGRPIVPETVSETYKTAGFLPLLWLACVLVAPLWEEMFFRGFVYKGIEASRLGAIGAIVVTALFWSALHVQYDLYGISSIFAAGILLGVVRLKTGSIYPCIAMHLMQNFIATAEAALLSAA